MLASRPHPTSQTLFAPRALSAFMAASTAREAFCVFAATAEYSEWIVRILIPCRHGAIRDQDGTSANRNCGPTVPPVVVSSN